MYNYYIIIIIYEHEAIQKPNSENNIIYIIGAPSAHPKTQYLYMLNELQPFTIVANVNLCMIITGGRHYLQSTYSYDILGECIAL